MASPSMTLANVLAPVSSRNPALEPVSSLKPPTPMKVTWSPNSLSTSTTVGASRRQNGHQGAQNHNTTSSPASASRSTWPPPKISNSPLNGAGPCALAVVADDAPPQAEATKPKRATSRASRRARPNCRDGVANAIGKSVRLTNELSADFPSFSTVPHRVFFLQPGSDSGRPRRAQTLPRV